MSAPAESHHRVGLVRPQTPIGPGPASVGWAIGWIVGTIVIAPVIVAAFGVSFDDLTISQLAGVIAGGWLAFVAAVVVVSRRFGTGDLIGDLGFRFAPIDLVGVPIGVATQVLLVPALYVPLRSIWPDTFSSEQVEERAQDLADRAGGWLTVLLIVVVVIGAPLVEEVVYRGLLQRSFASAVGPILGLLGTSIWFSLIHLSPVEYPGLFLAGFVFGGFVTLTGRIGPAIITHAAFNAAGLYLVLNSGG